MSNAHVPANTSPNNIPLSVSPDSQAVDLANRPRELTPEEEKLKARAQARKEEGHQTSERLEQVEKELADLEESREKAESELNAASEEYADGVQGSQEKISKLRDQLREYEDRTDALQRAHRAERDRLDNEYIDKVARAQDKLREQISDRAAEIAKTLEQVEKDAEKLEKSLSNAEQGMQSLIGLTQSPTAGSTVSSNIEALRKALAVQLGLSSTTSGAGRGKVPLKQMAPRASQFQDLAEIPEYLTDLPDPDAD